MNARGNTMEKITIQTRAGNMAPLYLEHYLGDYGSTTLSEESRSVDEDHGGSVSGWATFCCVGLVEAGLIDPDEVDAEGLEADLITQMEAYRD
jgi:hypothetical protein